MIPKVIHYVWVGGKPLTPLAQKCIKSWQKYCPDYEIKRWDESNFDISNNLYCREAYESQKWAFVSDYIRLKVLYEYGGIYMDTDVELIKPIDSFLSYKAFSGFENDQFIPTGIIASEKGNNWILNCLKYYDDRHFIKENGEYDYTTNVVTITNTTKDLYPEVKLNNTLQNFEEVTFFPKDYFCPLDYITGKLILTDNTHSIHWYNGSWLPKRLKFRKHFKKFCNVLTFGLAGKIYSKIKDMRSKK